MLKPRRGNSRNLILTFGIASVAVEIPICREFPLVPQLDECASLAFTTF